MADNNLFPGENNTGHIWDDNVRELSNPPPKWWMIGLWASLAWCVAYGFIYPMWPIGAEPTKGFTDWSQINEYNESMAEIKAKRAQFEDKITNMSAAAILKDEGLSSYVEASSKVLYGDNCAACHGSGGMGGPGFPVIADDDWLFGGSIDMITASITNGRKGVMTSHSKIMTDAEATTLANAVVAGKPTSEPMYMTKGCVACHGMDGKGMAVLGSANLTDSIYRFLPEEGQSLLDSVKYTILHGVNDGSDPKTREAEMPAFGNRLSKDDIKKLAVFVHKMGGGQ